MHSIKAVYVNAVSKLKGIPEGLIVLMARVGLGAFFVRAGQTKVDSHFAITDSTLYLFREEYQVPLLAPEIAAYMAATVEHLLGGLLILGLATRLSALGLLGMTLTIQVFVYPGSWPDHLLWASALVLILARGPGWIALDTVLWRFMNKT